MPTYDYQCRKCGHRFELFHSIKDDTPKKCPRCRGRCDRVPAAGAGILFKGSGFYITDYRSREYREQAKHEKGGGAPASDASSASATGGGGGTDAARPASASPSTPADSKAGSSTPPASGATKRGKRRPRAGD